MTDNRTSYSEQVQKRRRREREEIAERRGEKAIEMANSAVVDGDKRRCVAALWYARHYLDADLGAVRTVQEADRDLPYHFTPIMRFVRAVDDVARSVGVARSEPSITAREAHGTKADRAVMRHNAWPTEPISWRWVKHILETTESVAIVRGVIPADVNETYVLEADQL